MWGMLWKFLHSFTPSPRRPRPLGGSVINGTIQQLLDTPRGEPVTTNLAGTPHSRATWFHPRGCGKAPTAPAQRHTAPRRGFTARTSTRMWQGTPSARTAPHSAPTSTRMRQGTPSGLSGGGAGIFPQWGILKNNQKESIHETRWASSRRRASSWIPERRHGGYAGGAVGIAGRAGGCRYRGTGRHRTERHQRVGAGIGGLCDTGQDTRAATGGTRRGAIARDTPRHVRFSHRQLVRRTRGHAFPPSWRSATAACQGRGGGCVRSSA